MSNKWMAPKDYFEHIVVPTLQEYCDDKADHHKESAIFQLSSFSERFFNYYSKNGDTEKVYGATRETDFRLKVFELCPEWGLLWDFANGVKHHFPDGRSHRWVSDEATATAAWGHDEYAVGGRWVTLDQAIKVVFEFWRNLLVAESD